MKLFIKAKRGHEGFRRAGRAWPCAGVEVDSSDFTVEQLKQLKAENKRYLIVKEIGESQGAEYKRFRLKATGETVEFAGQTVTKRGNVFNPDKEKVTKEDIDAILKAESEGIVLIELYDESLKKYRKLNEGESLL